MEDRIRLFSVDGVQDSTIKVTMSLEARGMSLTGQYSVVPLDGDIILCRIGHVDLSNSIHENPAFGPFIMKYGRVAQWSGDVDIEKGKLQVVSVLNAHGQRTVLRRNPSSGTSGFSVRPEDIDPFMNEQVNFLTIGEIPHSGGIRATIRNRHFGKYETGGYGESKQESYFGKSGKGKTVLFLMRLVGRLAAYPEMGLLMPDTAGDLADPTRFDRIDFQWNYVEALRTAGVEIDIIDIENIRLTGRHTLKQLLQPLFEEALSMSEDKARPLADRVVESMYDGKVDAKTLTSDEVLNQMVQHIGGLYNAGKGRNLKVADAQALGADIGRRRPFDRQLNRIRTFFDGRYEIDDLVRGVLMDGMKVVIRMDTSHGITETEQEYVMHELMSNLSWMANWVYKKNKDKLCNAMIALDEAHRWVPEGDREERSTAGIIRRAYRESRKLGVGWTMITQSMADISKAVLRQSHTKWFLGGLGVGVDKTHLEDLLGKDGLAAYEKLDSEGGYFAIGIGDDANIGSDSSYFMVKLFDGNATKAFIEANPSLYRSRF